MQYFPAALQNLTDQFARLPGVGGKTAQRLAFHVLELPLDDALELERQIFKDCYTSSDRTEATSAFLEKRPHAPYNNRADFTK